MGYKSAQACLYLMVVLVVVSSITIALSYYDIKKYTMINSQDTISVKLILLHIVCFLLATVSSTILFLSPTNLFKNDVIGTVTGQKYINIT